MNARTPPSDTAFAEREQRRQAMVDLHLQRLDQVIEAGMGMISALAAQVAGTGPQVVEGDVALAYSRFSRAVRQGILLQTHLLAEPEEKPEREAKASRAKDDDDREMTVTWLEPEQNKREGRRERVAQIVERMARSDGEPEETVERLYNEAAERLEMLDVYGDPAFRPISELVAEICRDLGLNPDWAVLATHPWAQKEIALDERPTDDCLHEEAGWPLKGGPPPPQGWRGRWPPKPPPQGWHSGHDDAWPHKRGKPHTIDDVEWMTQAAALNGDMFAAGVGVPESGDTS
jgi:hypothetical protein